MEKNNADKMAFFESFLDVKKTRKGKKNENFRSRIVANLSGSERMVAGVFGTIETIEDYVALLRKAYHLKLSDVKVNVELLGSLKDVN